MAGARGGTDFYPSQGTRPVRDDVLDIGAQRSRSMPPATAFAQIVKA
jgi:hypothetical protein